MRRMLIAVSRSIADPDPAPARRISHGAASMTDASETSAKTQTNPRISFRNRAVRSSPCAAVSMGTKAKTMLLISTEFSVSIGPIATASESA